MELSNPSFQQKFTSCVPFIFKNCKDGRIRVVVSHSLIRKPPPLQEIDEDYRSKLEKWMGDWYPEESDNV